MSCVCKGARYPLAGALCALLLAACGGNEATETAGGAAGEAQAAARVNHPPRIERVEIRPEAPSRGDMLVLDVDVVDPERESVDLKIDWLASGRVVESGTTRRISAEQFRRGEAIRARVTASDGHAEVSLLSDAVSIANAPPRVSSLQLVPSDPTGGQDVVVTADGVDPDGDAVELRYTWWRNDQVLEGQTEPTLPGSEFARGDRIWVEVVPFDGDDEGEPMRSRPVAIRNAAPRITSEPVYAPAGSNLYEYAVTAEDPDGDRPLRYELIEGPPGMEIDLLSGLLRWEVPETAAGRYTIEVAVSDPHGSRTHQRYAIQLDWEAPAAAQVPASTQP